MSPNARPNLAQFTGSNDPEEIYQRQWIDTGVVSERDRLPVGTRGFNVTKLMKRAGARKTGLAPVEPVEQPKDHQPGQHSEYGAVRINNWVEGWAKHLEDTYGHRNAFLAMSVLGEDENLEYYAEDSMDKAESVLEKVATKTVGPNASKTVDAGVVQDATPILIDPDFLSVVREAAPVLDWVNVVAQAGFTASYNVISDRDDAAPGWSSENDVRDLSGETGSAFTMPNTERDMKIWTDVLDVSDFSSRAQASLDFMDLEGTSLEIRGQEYALEEATSVLYGNPTDGVTDGHAHDENAPEGIEAIAADDDEFRDNNSIDKSSHDLSGDKPLFEDLKKELLGLVNGTNARLPNLGIVTSLDLFHELENEANVNVRIDSFDAGMNFGRDPMGPTTLSIAGVPVLPDPNVRDHSLDNATEYDGDHGDVFIFDRENVQRRALQALSSTTLGQLGLADRMALFQYRALIDRSEGQHTKVLRGYDVPSLS